jgi:hypothetical protein
MIRDGDRIYGAVVIHRLRAMGIRRDKPIAPASPWQNGFAERLIGSIRREFVDHVSFGRVVQCHAEKSKPQLRLARNYRKLFSLQPAGKDRKLHQLMLQTCGQVLATWH